jgi:hypothetical protein
METAAIGCVASTPTTPSGLARAPNRRHAGGMSDPRKFRPPWKAEEQGESFVVSDADDHPLAYVYFEEEVKRRDIMRRLTKDQARRIAANIAKLPQLLFIAKQAKTGFFSDV